MLQRHLCGSRSLHSTVCSVCSAYTLHMLYVHECWLLHTRDTWVSSVKQRCQDLVWWPGINHDVEVMVMDCAACRLSGIKGPICPTASAIADLAF